MRYVMLYIVTHKRLMTNHTIPVVSCLFSASSSRIFPLSLSPSYASNFTNCPS